MDIPSDARVLVVDDDASTGQLLCEFLRLQAIAADWRSDPDQAWSFLGREAEAVDLVITDHCMHGVSGAELCCRIVEKYPDVPVVVMTGFGTLRVAVEALRAGAFDFITKPCDLPALLAIARRAIRQRRLRALTSRPASITLTASRYGGLLGVDARMRDLYAMIDRVAASDATVLVTGASGTGKELVARELHERSERRQRPFVALNCSAIPPALFESELFGHVRGAFTGAHSMHLGLLARANGGTVLLDELGEMPIAVQPKLLRALQERKVRPVGANSDTPIDVRVIASTHQDLEHMVKVGAFRADLYYRVSVVGIAVPRLSVRGQDVLLLAQCFVEKFAAAAGRPVPALSPRVGELLLAYPWPGNVRELQNCIQRAVVLCNGDSIGLSDLPNRIREHRSQRMPLEATTPHAWLPIGEVEKRYVLAVLGSVKGNKTCAAHVLGLSRKTLYRRLREYGVMTDSTD